jgi:hypothetical protein
MKTIMDLWALDQFHEADPLRGTPLTSGNDFQFLEVGLLRGSTNAGRKTRSSLARSARGWLDSARLVMITSRA